VCPSCRVKLSRDHPSRNRFAENILATVEVECANEGCAMKVPFGKLKEHEENLCGFRKASCKFTRLGCEWTGIHANLAEHEKSCPIRGKNAKSILKLLQERDQKKKIEETASIAASIDEGSVKVCKLLSSRAREIVIKDVVLERDEVCDEVCSKTFMALGFAWEVILTKEKVTKKPALNMRLISGLRRKLPVTFFILPGPFVELKIPPSIYSAEFRKRRNHHNNHVCVLQVSEEVSKVLSDAETLHLRIGFLDRSRGISRWFSSQDRRYDSDDGSTSSSSSEDEGGRDSVRGDHDYSDEEDDEYMDDGIISYEISGSDADSGMIDADYHF
jgi:hypothetical protein